MLHEKEEFNAKAAKRRQEAQRDDLRDVDALFYEMWADSVLVHRCFPVPGTAHRRFIPALMCRRGNFDGLAAPDMGAYEMPPHPAVFSLPVADYTADGSSDLAVYGEGRWRIISTNGNLVAWVPNWGFPGAQALAGDFDGDGQADLAVFSDGQWFIRSLTSGVLAWNLQWGFPEATPLVADFTGNQRADMAVYHEGRWFILSLDGDVLAWNLDWGFAGALPVAADFDGDGQADLAVYHEGEWYIRTLSGSVLAWKLF